MALPPVTTRLEIPEWTGGRLSNGDFLAYAAAVAGIYSAAGLQALSIEEVGERLLRTVDELNAAFNRQRSFDETTNISKADATRDVLFNVLWLSWERFTTLDQHHPFYVAANTLRSEMTKYKGASRLKLAEETEALYGLQAALLNPQNGAALETLGLDKVAAALWDANEATRTAMDERDAERGERAEARADGSVPELRKATADLLCQCAKRVNALYMITPSEDVAKVIKAAYGVVEQYRHVAAQPAKHKGKDDPEPEPAPEAAK